MSISTILLFLAGVDWWLLARDLVAAFLAGAILYRVRGGWLGRYIPGGTFPARLIWAVPTGALVGGLLGGWPVGVAEAGAAYVVLMNTHGRWMDVGHVDGRTSDDVHALSAVGVERLYGMLLPIGILWSPSVLLLAPAGLLQGPLYWLAWKLPVRVEWRLAEDKAPVDGETAWGELLWGGVQWVLLVLACRIVGGT
ncbi:hypothetical protein [Azospirillum sp.]|uniref:hypothetical protein n=1 Tax=Azospirillum sp. TaxID=34012 RepID=UPI003D75191F